MWIIPQLADHWHTSSIAMICLPQSQTNLSVSMTDRHIALAVQVEEKERKMLWTIPHVRCFLNLVMNVQGVCSARGHSKGVLWHFYWRQACWAHCVGPVRKRCPKDSCQLRCFRWVIISHHESCWTSPRQGLWSLCDGHTKATFWLNVWAHAGLELPVDVFLPWGNPWCALARLRAASLLCGFTSASPQAN